MVTRVLVARAGHNHAVARKLGAIQWRPQRNRHLAPFMERLRAAKFNATFVDGNGIGRQLELCLPRFNRHWFFKGMSTDESFCAHKESELPNNNTSLKAVKLGK